MHLPGFAFSEWRPWISRILWSWVYTQTILCIYLYIYTPTLSIPNHESQDVSENRRGAWRFAYISWRISLTNEVSFLLIIYTYKRKSTIDKPLCKFLNAYSSTPLFINTIWYIYIEYTYFFEASTVISERYQIGHLGILQYIWGCCHACWWTPVFSMRLSCQFSWWCAVSTKNANPLRFEHVKHTWKSPFWKYIIVPGKVYRYIWKSVCGPAFCWAAQKFISELLKNKSSTPKSHPGWERLCYKKTLDI